MKSLPSEFALPGLVAIVLIVGMLTGSIESCRGCVEPNYRYYKNQCIEQCAPTWRTAEQCQELCR